MKTKEYIAYLNLHKDIVKMFISLCTVYLAYLVVLFYIIELITNNLKLTHVTVIHNIFNFPYIIYDGIFIVGLILLILFNLCKIISFLKKYYRSIMVFNPINWIDYSFGAFLLVTIYEILSYKFTVLYVFTIVIIIRLIIPLIKGILRPKHSINQEFPLELDIPIKKIDEDKLHRENFIDNLYDRIKNLNFDKSFVFGLYGEWGSGKTSMLNLLKEKLKKEKDIIVIDFNPWIYDDETAILNGLYNEIDIALNKEYLMDNLRSALLKYAKLLSTGVNLFNFFIFSFSNVGQADIKKRISKVIKRIDKRIVVIIDDIDRMSPENILYIFKLVNIVNNFDKLFFIISCDKEIINKKIKNKVKDPLYLERIIQTDESVPKILLEDIISYIENDLIKIYKYFDIDMGEYSFAYLNYFGSYFADLRKVKKYINLIKIDIGSISTKDDKPFNKKDIYLTDFFILEMLKTFFLIVYDDIYSNSSVYIKIDKRGDLYGDSIFKNIANDQSQSGVLALTHLNLLLGNIDYKYREYVSNAICYLFPRVENLFLNTKDLHKTYNNLYTPMQSPNKEKDTDSLQSRIWHEDSFYRYFTMRISKKDISYNEMKTYIELLNNSNDINSIANFFLATMDKKLLIDKLSNSSWGLKTNGSIKLIKIICNNIEKLKKKPEDIYVYIDFIKSLLNIPMVNPNETIMQGVFKDIFNSININKKTFLFIVSLYSYLNLNTQGGQFLRSPDMRRETRSIINRFIKNTEYNTFKDNINNRRDFILALYHWLGYGTTISADERNDNSIHVKGYIKRSVVDKKSLINFISILKDANFDLTILNDNEFFGKEIFDKARKILKYNKSLKTKDKNLLTWFIKWKL
ncbi:MAG: KAP family P-loop NTPase fold protein [Patescibacteria group bacterium]